MATEDRKDDIPKVGNRRSNKPIMEKRRRARINASLTELKSLLLQVMKQDGNRFNKLEKADILEMTVKYLRQIQRRSFTAAAATDPTVFNKYQVGYNECAGEVSRYLASLDGVNDDMKARLMTHLIDNVQGVKDPVPAQPATQRNVTSPVIPQGQVSPHDFQKNIGGNPVSIAPKLPAVQNPGTVLSFPGATVPQFQFSLLSGAGLQLIQNGSMGFVVPSGVVVTSPHPGSQPSQDCQDNKMLGIPAHNSAAPTIVISPHQMSPNAHPASMASPSSLTTTTTSCPTQGAPRSPASGNPTLVSCADRDLNNNVVASEVQRKVSLRSPRNQQRDLLIENTSQKSFDSSVWRPW